MRLSTRGKYGVYAMIFLAQHAGEGPQALKAFSDVGVPEAYLEQLLGDLRKAGLVTTVRGAHGGYALSRPAEEINARQILEAMEGPLRFSDCVADPNWVCDKMDTCLARGVWGYLTGEINDLLGRISLTMMVNQELEETQKGETLL